jgi:threonine/homoserine/homoserine lactone efflux protein
MHSRAVCNSLPTVVTVMPVSGTALINRNTRSGGRLAGVSAGLGLISGQMIWVVVTSYGISALF